jgi:Fibronectin type III domain
MQSCSASCAHTLVMAYVAYTDPSHMHSWICMLQLNRTATAKPDAPAAPKLSNITATSVHITVVTPVTHGDAMHACAVEMREHFDFKQPQWSRLINFDVTTANTSTSSSSTSSSSSSGSLKSVTIVYSDLQPRAHYSFRVAAVNAVGRSEWSKPSNRIMTLPAPED